MEFLEKCIDNPVGMLYDCVRTIIQGGGILSWQFNDKEPVFVQIEKRLRAEIVNGRYLPDSQIPTVRQLATEISVNPNTVQRALTVLEEEGLVVSRGTVGRFVTGDPLIISEARRATVTEAMRGWLSEAYSLGITKEELLEFISKEEI